MNSKGLAVGSIACASGCTTHGFIYNLNTQAISYYSVPGSASTVFSGINDQGQIVGTADNSAFRRNTDGTYTTLNLPNPAAGAFAYGISNTGYITGTYYPTGTSTPYSSAFILNPLGSLTTITPPEPGPSCMLSCGNLYIQYIQYIQGFFGNYVNDTGQIIGSYGQGGNAYAFYTQSNVADYTSIGTAGPPWAEGIGLTDDGARVIAPKGLGLGYVLAPDGTNLSLGSTGISLFSAWPYALNSADQILVHGIYGFSSDHPIGSAGEFLVTFVDPAATSTPEPATTGLGLAMLGTIFFLRSRSS